MVYAFVPEAAVAERLAFGASPAAKRLVPVLATGCLDSVSRTRGRRCLEILWCAATALPTNLRRTEQTS